MQTKEVLKIAYNAIDEKMGIDINVIDISDISIMSDYFIITSASSKSQMEAIVDNVEEKIHEAIHTTPKREGRGNDSWILLDYGEFVIHIFNKEARAFYNLDHVWSDGKSIDF